MKIILDYLRETNRVNRFFFIRRRQEKLEEDAVPTLKMQEEVTSQR